MYDRDADYKMMTETREVRARINSMCNTGHPVRPSTLREWIDTLDDLIKVARSTLGGGTEENLGRTLEEIDAGL